MINNQSPLSADLAQDLTVAELSHVVRLDAMNEAPQSITLEANENECAAIASRFDLPYVHNLSADITYRRIKNGQMVRVEGRVFASYGQACAKTGQTMPMSMEEKFQTEYTLSAWEKFSEFDLDQPEVLTDDFVDLGEVTTQYFGLAIDPYANRGAMERLDELTSELSATLNALASARQSQANYIEAIPESFDIAQTVMPNFQNMNGYVNNKDNRATPAEIIPLHDVAAIAENRLQKSVKPSPKVTIPGPKKVRIELCQSETQGVDTQEIAQEPRLVPTLAIAQNPRESLFFKHLRKIRGE